MKYEYIEKEFVLYLVQHFGSMLTWSKEDTLAEIEQEVKDTKPIGDVFRVVRCKDCKHWNHMGDGVGDCTNGRFHLDGCPDPTMAAEEFCCLGERKDNA